MRKQSLIMWAVLAALGLMPQAHGQGVLNALEKEIGSLVDGIKPSLVTVEAAGRETQHRSWVGSGVVWSSDGKIVTTASLISGEDQVTVTLSDGRELPAAVLGIDDEYNLALLKVDGAGLPAVRLGNSDLVKPGSWVTVIGNSYGLASSVNFGLANGVRGQDSLLQLSASVAPGNTGGPVLNTQGEMIGMVHGRMSEPLDLGPLRIFEQDRKKTIALFPRPLDMPVSETSLAIPSNKIRTVCDELDKNGTRKKGFLGVNIGDLSEQERKEFKVQSGLRVEDVIDDSPAAKVGLNDDDILLEFNGKKVSSTGEFRRQVAGIKPGTTVKLKLKRDGREKSLSVALGEAPGRSLQLRMKQLHLPELDIDIPEIDLQHLERIKAGEQSRLREELKDLKNELRQMQKELRDQRENVKKALERDKKKMLEKEGNM